MKTSSLYWFLIPPALLLSLTFLGVVTGSKTILAFCGLTIFAFWTFVAASAGSLSEWLKTLTGWLERKQRSSYPSLVVVISLLTEGSLLVRALAFSAAKWTVDFYLSLCKGNLRDFFENVDVNIVLTLLAVVLAVADISRGKSIKDHGFPTRILTIYGAMQFIKNVVLLLAVSETHIVEKLETLFSWRPWFLDNRSRIEVLSLGYELGLGPTILALIFGTMFLVMGIRVAKETKAPDDAKCFGIALAVITGWLLAVPLYSLVHFIWFLANGQKQ